MRRLVPILALAASCSPPRLPAGAARGRAGRSSAARPRGTRRTSPGCRPRCVRGATIPRGWVLLSRRVRLDAGERRASVTFRCPGARRFRTFGFLEGGDVLLQIPDEPAPVQRAARRVRLLAERGLTPVSAVGPRDALRGLRAALRKAGTFRASRLL